MKSKKITKSGGITVPSDIRRASNLMPGDAVDIEQQGRKIIITPHINKCFICREERDVIAYQDKFFCKACIKALGGMVND